MNTDVLRRSRPLRILHVVGGMNRGGVETWLMHILRSVDRRDCSMDFLVHTDRPCAYDDEIRELGATVDHCERPDRPWAYTRNFRRIIRERGPFDVVHSHVYLFSGFVLRLAKRLHIPGRIAHIYPAFDSRRPSSFRRLYRSLMEACIRRNSTHLISCSRHSLGRFLENGRFQNLNADVIYPLTKEYKPWNEQMDRNEVRRRFGLPTDCPIVIYVARFAPHKNHAQMVRVADLLRDRGTNAHFVMVGSHGDLLDHFVQLSAARDDLSVLRNVADVSELLSSSDVFFFPTRDEGFGIVAAEAAAAGLPIVATDLPALREAIPVAHQRFMFPADDDASAVDRIHGLLHDSERRLSAADAARTWAAGLSPQRSIDALLSIYQSSQH